MGEGYEPMNILSRWREDPLTDINLLFSSAQGSCTLILPLLEGREPFARGKVGAAYLLPVKGWLLVVKMSPKAKGESEFINVGDIRGVCPCLCQSQIGSLALDEFSNEALIAYGLEAAFRERGMPPLFVKHLLDIRCPQDGSTGISFIEYCDYGDLAHFGSEPLTSSYLIQAQVLEDGVSSVQEIIRPQALIQIIKQLVCAFDFLSSISFISGDAKTGNILIQGRAVNTQYKGVRLSSEFTVKIADYGKSTLTLNTKQGLIRLFNHNTLASLYNRLDSFDPEVYSSNGVRYYLIQESTEAQLFAHLRHQGRGYYSSFDGYTALVSLMLLPKYYYSLQSSEELKGLWSRLWLDSKDQMEVESRMRRMWGSKDALRYAGAIQVLKGIKMKCDLYPELLGYLSRIRL